MKELYSNGFASSIAQAIEEMKAEQGDGFSLDRINLAELERRSGVSRGKLRRLKRNGFQDLPRRSKGRKHAAAKPSGYTGIIDSLLRQGIKNSSVIRDRLRQSWFDGGATIVKEYIASHKHLIPAKRQQIAPVAREIDFIAASGGKKIYIQSTYALGTEEKAITENKPFALTGDSFPKIIVRHDIRKRWYDDNGILNIGVIDFLLDDTLV